MRPLSHSGSSIRYSSKEEPLPESRSVDSMHVNNPVEPPLCIEPDQNSASSKDALLDSEGAMALEPIDCHIDEIENVKDRETDSRESEDVDSGCSECESVGSDNAASDVGDERPNWCRKPKTESTERYEGAVSDGNVKEAARPKSLPKEQRGESIENLIIYCLFELFFLMSFFFFTFSVEQPKSAWKQLSQKIASLSSPGTSSDIEGSRTSDHTSPIALDWLFQHTDSESEKSCNGPGM